MSLEGILKSLYILQKVSNEGRSPKLGRGYFEAQRFNPYNPLSYIWVIVILIICIVMFGPVGTWIEIKKTNNPFKWD